MIIPLSDSDLPLILHEKAGESGPSVRHFLKGALTSGSRSAEAKIWIWITGSKKPIISGDLFDVTESDDAISAALTVE